MMPIFEILRKILSVGKFLFKMKNILFLIILFFSFFSSSYSQVLITSSEKYKQAGLVWGLLKYHHPEIGAGKYDWGNTLVELFGKLKTVQSQDEMNHC